MFSENVNRALFTIVKVKNYKASHRFAELFMSQRRFILIIYLNCSRVLVDVARPEAVATKTRMYACVMAKLISKRERKLIVFGSNNSDSTTTMEYSWELVRESRENPPLSSRLCVCEIFYEITSDSKFLFAREIG